MLKVNNETIANLLREGTVADIWYDATYNEEDDTYRRTITLTQEAMLQAAEILEKLQIGEYEK